MLVVLCDQVLVLVLLVSVETGRGRLDWIEWGLPPGCSAVLGLVSDGPGWSRSRAGALRG